MQSSSPTVVKAKYWQIGDYKVSEMCMQSYPCQHTIVNIQSNIHFTLDGASFYRLLKKDGLSHPHFDEYARDCNSIQFDNFVINDNCNQ